MAELSRERADLVESLQTQRHFLRRSVEGLTDEQASLRPTASELCLAGLVKHTSFIEGLWARFAVVGPAAHDIDPAEWAAQWDLAGGETLADVLARYAEVAARTDELAASLDLDAEFPLPEAPWFPPGATRSVRRTLTHVIGETAQHAGHADILRESIDGRRSMG